MAEMLQIPLKLSLVIFMVGNLLDIGLRLKLREALGGLRNAWATTLTSP
jgi:BASS family bile acid:Na+ symporter